MIFLSLVAGLAVAAPTSYSAKVVHVVDGDTLKVELAGQIESIRLIGIDTPESKANKKAQKDAGRSHQDIQTIVSLGEAAFSFTKSIVKPGDLVRIEQGEIR